MTYRFWANLKTIFQLDDATFTLLEECMRNHYDGTVKGCTEHGGFMYGYRNTRDFRKDTPDDEYRNTLELDSRQHQLCMKALEMRHYYHTGLHKQLDELNDQLHKLWHAYVAQMEKLNNEVLEAGGTV